MPTAKKTDDDTPDEAPAEAQVCVNCGEPATMKTTNPATNEVFYCDRHARLSGEGTAPI